MKTDVKYLAAEVTDLVADQDHEQEPVTVWDRLTGIPDRKVSEAEALSRLWGYVYGLSVGVVTRECPDLSPGDLADKVFDVAASAFRDGPLITLELIRLLESERIDTDLMNPETLESISASLTELEEAF